MSNGQRLRNGVPVGGALASGSDYVGRGKNESR
jgi:hypothetical protein